MEERRRLRRRADSATVAGDHLLLYRASGVLARIAVVVDQLDDDGLRTPLVEDVLAAFPHGELHVASDRRAWPRPVAGRTPLVWPGRDEGPRGLWRRRRRTPTPTPDLGDYDLVLRLGDRRSRGFLARADALDLTFITALDDAEGDAREAQLGAGLRDRCAMQSADVVWCATRRLLATLRRRWQVEAQLLYPPAELGAVGAEVDARRLILAAADGISPAWNARLDTLARWYPDLEVVKHGRPRVKPRRAEGRIEPPTPERFAALVGGARAVVMPPGDSFDPRAVWAAAAGVPVIAPISSASAETVEGLERREPTGVLLEEVSDAALADGVAFIERHGPLFAPERLRAHATRWSHDRFRRTLKSLVLEAWCAHVAATSAFETTPDPAFESEGTAAVAPLQAEVK